MQTRRLVCREYVTSPKRDIRNQDCPSRKVYDRLEQGAHTSIQVAVSSAYFLVLKQTLREMRWAEAQVDSGYVHLFSISVTRAQEIFLGTSISVCKDLYTYSFFFLLLLHNSQKDGITKRC